MKNSNQSLKSISTIGEKLSTEKLLNVKGGCGTITDPKRCAEDLFAKIISFFKK